MSCSTRVANQQTLPEAVRIALKGGTVVVVGGARRPVTIDLPVVEEDGSASRVPPPTAGRTSMTQQQLSANPDFDAGRFVTATFALPRARKP